MDHFVCRVFGILLVVVIYSAFTVEGADVAYGDACVASDTCIGTGNYACISDACACDTSYFRNTANDACVSKVALTTTCADGEPADQCTDTLAECRDETGFKCLCKAGNFKNKDTVCAPQVGLDGTCDSTDSATDQCSVTNTECDSTDNKCLCKATYYSDGSACVLQKVGLDTPCDATESASDQCAVENSECRLDGAAGKCLCKATHYVDGTACTIRRKPDETCGADQCVEHATCDTVSPTKCECDVGYTATPTDSPTMCSGVVKFASLSYMYVVPILVSMMSLLR